MIDPVIAASMLFGGCRLVTSAERGTSRLAGEREQRDLVRCASSLPAGTEIGEVRADGSSWWIRIPTAASS
jgi:uncharacterized membrane protein